MSGLESALEELYSSDPAGFTKKRDALAKQLKAGGDKEAAASVTARRKPTQIAWVLNQLARREPDAIADLVDVGRDLAREQRRALRGDKAGGLRESIDRQRKTITALAHKTTALMKDLGVDPAAHLDEVTSALQAALVDPAVGAQLEEGRFEKAPEAAVGFGGPVPEDFTPREAPKPAPKKHDDSKEKAAAARKKKKKKKALAEHARAVSAAKAGLKEAELAAKRARQAADRAEDDAKTAIERAKELAADADEKEAAIEPVEKALAKLIANAPD